MKTLPILQLDQPTLTNRVFPSTVVAAALENFQQHRPQGMIGQYGFPSAKDRHQWYTVNLDRASHRIDNLRIEGSQVVGEVTSLKSPFGKILEEQLDRGEVAFRIRGLVEYQPSSNTPGEPLVVSKLSLISVDAVNPDTAA